NKHFQETLHVTKAQSGLLQAAYFGAYFLVALPAGYFMDRKGYKAGILVGLCLYALGALLFVPTASANSFGGFLFALFVIASGLGCLETAANPYATVLG
ncbi:MFS transporter, partial [Pseudomonas aeruginosa]